MELAAEALGGLRDLGLQRRLVDSQQAAVAHHHFAADRHRAHRRPPGGECEPVQRVVLTVRTNDARACGWIFGYGVFVRALRIPFPQGQILAWLS